MIMPETQNYRNNVDNAAGIVSEYSDFIRLVICSQVKNKSHVDDIFQDFFLSLVAGPVPRNIKNIKSYLYRAICNDIVDRQREVERYKDQVKKYQEKNNFSINNDQPENALIIEEQMNKMFGLIKGRLTSTQFQAIDLRFRNNHSILEVAEKMGVKVSTVSRYICTGLRRMRQSFK